LSEGPIGQMQWLPVPMTLADLTFVTGLDVITIAGDAALRQQDVIHSSRT
jgi:hypothetical protein